MPTKKTYVPARATKKKLTKASVTRQVTAWWEKEKRKLSSARLCDRCEAVWYDGHWHTAPEMAAAIKARRKAARGKKEAPVLCYECHLAAHGADPSKAPFEGQLTLDGLVDATEKAEILSTIRNFAARAAKRDPEDRVISIEDRGARVVVTTTENQMAVGAGKAVDKAFKGGKLKIVWSKEDAPARVFWTHKRS